MDNCWKACIVIGFLICGFLQQAQHTVEALQCYVCENCVEGTELQVMQICGELPIESTLQPSSSAPTATTASTSNMQNGGSTNAPATTTTMKGDDDDDDTDEEDSDEEDSDEERRRGRDDIRTVTFAESTLVPTTVDSSSSSGNNSTTMPAMIDEDSYEDAFKRQNGHVKPKQFVPVCYMVKFQAANGSLYTNLGCTSMVAENEYLTCISLNKTDSNIEDCRLCSMNGCNKYFFNTNINDYDWDYVVQSRASKRSFDVWQTYVALLMLPAFVSFM